LLTTKYEIIEPEALATHSIEPAESPATFSESWVADASQLGFCTIANQAFSAIFREWVQIPAQCMSSTRLEVSTIIEDEIHRQGPISFARFMELALYHPKSGYYRSGHTVFGAGGDFYTAEQLTPVFGELLATFVSSLSSRTLDEAFEVLELGAGRRDLRTALSAWNYRGFDWTGDSLPNKMTGMVLANEFFDALPVHRLRRTSNGWRETLVTSHSGRFCFEDGPILSGQLLEYAELYGREVPINGILEACLRAREWLQTISELLVSGHVLVMDYGYSAQELRRFPEGTLLSYQRHHATHDVLEAPGTRDITAHVNFSYLRDMAVRTGFHVVSESSLVSWALRVWNEPELSSRWSKADDGWRLQWKHLVVGMGETFRVLMLRRAE
jgi:SAM-dependent MidA family methyltransferase